MQLAAHQAVCGCIAAAKRFASGGELFDYIVAHQRVKEKEVSKRCASNYKKLLSCPGQVCFSFTSIAAFKRLPTK